MERNYLLLLLLFQTFKHTLSTLTCDSSYSIYDIRCGSSNIKSCSFSSEYCDSGSNCLDVLEETSRCTHHSECKSRRCIEGSCQDNRLGEGEYCRGTNDCEKGLYCSTICTKQKTEKEPCSLSEECDSRYGCSLSECTKWLSVEIGSYASSKDFCELYYESTNDDAIDAKLCAQPPVLQDLQNGLKLCDLEIDCQYSPTLEVRDKCLDVQDSTDSTDGLKYCTLGGGEPNVLDAIQELKNYHQKKPECVDDGELGCNEEFSEMGTYYKSRVETRILDPDPDHSDASLYKRVDSAILPLMDNLVECSEYAQLEMKYKEAAVNISFGYLTLFVLTTLLI